MDQDEISKFNLRIPTWLYDAIIKRASYNKRSVNNEIAIILERFVNSREIMEGSYPQGEQKTQFQVTRTGNSEFHAAETTVRYGTKKSFDEIGENDDTQKDLQNNLEQK